MTTMYSFKQDSLYARIGGWWTTVDQRLEHDYTVTFSKRALFRFRTHVHPFAERFVEELVNKEVSGFQAIDDRAPALREAFFTATYAPTTSTIDDTSDKAPVAAIIKPAASGTNPLEDHGLPVDEIDFDYAQGAYSVYNWELFFHVPFTLAVHLSKNGLFADAQRWLHYIFDPSDASDPKLGPKRFWKVLPFKLDEIERIEDTLTALSSPQADPEKTTSLVRAINAWRDDPFKPHLVARTRPTAYMYATVMAYLDNEIAWGDSLFRQDTAESINEAMAHYIAAADILGPKPEMVPSRGKSKAHTYNSLRAELDELGNATVGLEAELAFDLTATPPGPTTAPRGSIIESIGRSPYFCIPRNSKFLTYWDTVADRLFKIRNSRNLQGAFRQVPLFAPPIDPAMLARAAAAGVDVAAIVAGLDAPLAPVRFRVLHQKAAELASRVEAFGAQILQAIEKKDSETLGVLRAANEKTLLEAGDRVRMYQWQEAIKTREGIAQNIENVFQRYRYFERLLGRADAEIKKDAWPAFQEAWAVDESTRTFGEEPVPATRSVDISLVQSEVAQGRALIAQEISELLLSREAQDLQDVASATDAVGTFLNLIPMFSLDAKPIGMGAGAEIGGPMIAAVLSGLAGITRAISARTAFEGGQSGKMAGYVRREQEWTSQANAAAGELAQLYKQYRAAEVREHLAKKEYDNHQTQKKQAADVHEFLSNTLGTKTGDARKTTDEKFYLWMKGEAQALHARSFQMAYEVAKKAEKAFQEELGLRDRSFVGSTYLTGREGLYAGERLSLDLKAMDLAYQELDTRKLEIVKHVSLREWFPLELAKLRKDGGCSITLPEALFDLDSDGDISRRIHSVSVSLPCVAGPYASVHCSVLLSGTRVRTGPSDADLTTYPAAVREIVTSSAQNDAGTFDSNQQDDRYRPFEGAGVVDSTWTFGLLGNPRPFDYDTIADLVLTIRYTARSGGTKRNPQKWLKEHAVCAFSMRHEFSSEWARFKRTGSLSFDIGKDHFPYRLAGLLESENVKQAHLLITGDVGTQPVVFKREATTITSSTPFKATGTFSLELSPDVDDVWLVFDWLKPTP